jgi:XisH protein
VPARDLYHDVVKTALEKDGWRITHDPFHLAWSSRDMFIDLGAEMIAAERENTRIAVEVKSFISRSEITELERALGQFVLYEKLLERRDPGRLLFLAVPNTVLTNLFEDAFGTLLVDDETTRVFGFDPETKEVTKWLPRKP